MAMESTGVEAATSSVAISTAKDVQVSSVEETKTTVSTTASTTSTEEIQQAEEVVVEESSSSLTGEAEELESESSTTLSSTPPKASNSKKWYLPKVPSLLKKASFASAENGSAPPPPPPPEPVGEDEELPHSDGELRSLTEQPPERPTVAARLRGISIDQARSLVGKIGFRSQSSMSSTTTESPRNSIDGAPAQTQRRSILGGFSGSATTNVPSPRSDPNLKARRGACVATKFGTGTVLDIRLDDGFYIVQLVPKSVAFLREEMIYREIKAIVGERVKTRWGLATVEQYYADEDMYNIALDWRWDDDHVWRMKATTKKFEKINRSMSIVQNTKNKIFTGVSTIRESASYGYANVAAKINTTASTYKPAPRSQSVHSPTPPLTQLVPKLKATHSGPLGKALTPYGLCTVLTVRPDQFFVVETKCGATGYLHADSVKLLHRRTNFAVGERVKTPYGLGEVVVYRDEDEVYEVKLETLAEGSAMPPMLYISDLSAETMMLPASANGANYARLSSIFTMTRNSMYSASATVKASASGGLTTLSNVKSKVSTMAAAKMTYVQYPLGFD
jgi:hypothetical protein